MKIDLKNTITGQDVIMELCSYIHIKQCDIVGLRVTNLSKLRVACAPYLKSLRNA
ncbi:MAG: hypothetical protein FDX18_06790 [Chlorobium sp.]|nr:MAG: hypothetical protein FDX18_06790 [Chlorobium sp.]